MLRGDACKDHTRESVWRGEGVEIILTEVVVVNSGSETMGTFAMKKKGDARLM